MKQYKQPNTLVPSMVKPREIDNVFPSIAKATFNSRILSKQTIDDGLNIVQTTINTITH